MTTAATSALLYLDDVSVSFDGFRALNALSLVLEQGEMRAIIGPNGAGKTTMMDVVTGKTRPDEGEVFFDHGQIDLTRHDEAEIASMGIGRKFQKPTVFESHTVYDNVYLALKGPRGPLSALFGERNRLPRERVEAVLDRVRLGAHRDRRAGDLSHGQKQWLEIAMLLATRPKLLLLDEPTAGMTPAETRRTAALVRRIRDEAGIAAIVIEHDLAFVRDIGAPVAVMMRGRVVRRGSYAEVAADPLVRELYLGKRA